MPLVALLFPLMSLAWVGFTIWMLVDCLQAQDTFLWLILILGFQPFGPLIYFVTHKLHDFEVTDRWAAMWSGRRRVAELKAQIHHMDRPLHWCQLGDECMARHSWPDAAQCYAEAIQREPDMEEAHYGKGRALLALGKFDEALGELTPIVGENPRYAYGEGLLAIARAWRGLNRPQEAMSAYEELSQSYNYPWALFEYAELLYTNDKKEEATKLMRRLVADGRNASGFSKAKERRWGRKAGRFLRLHGLRA